jgi:hypothetical protein
LEILAKLKEPQLKRPSKQFISNPVRKMFETHQGLTQRLIISRLLYRFRPICRSETAMLKQHQWFGRLRIHNRFLRRRKQSGRQLSNSRTNQKKKASLRSTILLTLTVGPLIMKMGLARRKGERKPMAGTSMKRLNIQNPNLNLYRQGLIQIYSPWHKIYQSRRTGRQDRTDEKAQCLEDEVRIMNYLLVLVA